jgi:hypothetical protein
MENGFFDAPHVVAYRWMVVLSMGDGNPMAKATAEGRLYNHSPRLASLPGVSCGRINLPPKSGCINHGKYFSKLSQRPAIGSGVPPAREMGRMRRIPARIRFAPRTGLRKSAVAPRRCRCGDDSRHFYNRSSAVSLCGCAEEWRLARLCLMRHLLIEATENKSCYFCLCANDS